MASLKERVEKLEALLESHGVAIPGQRVQQGRSDFIAFGSDEHRRFLGLVIVNEDDDTAGYVLYASKESGVTYRLEDEIGVVSQYRGVDPEKAALLVLRQKVNELEGGAPTPPDDAPSLWQPLDEYTVPVPV